MVFARLSCGLRLALGAAALVLLAPAAGNAQAFDPMSSAGTAVAPSAGAEEPPAETSGPLPLLLLPAIAESGSSDVSSPASTVDSVSGVNFGDLFPAQNTTPQSEANQTQTEETQPVQSGSVQGATAQSEKDRLRVNPITGSVTSSGVNYKPLTADERWKLYFKMNYGSVGAYFGPVLTALLLDQTTSSPYQWGGGFPGFGRRLGSRVGNAILQGTFQAPTAALLHEDVRYIASSQRGFKRRARHSMAYSFLTYNSQGHPTLNIANLGSYYASTAATTAWLPGHYNLAGYTFSNGSEQIALSLPVNLFQEFWPEIRRSVFHR